MDTLLHDLRFAARSFARTPRFTIPAVLALALGIGVTAAVFSIIRGVMLKPLPYLDADRITVVWENNLKRNRPRNVISPANFLEWRARNRSFETLATVGPARLNLLLGGQPEEVAGVVASSDFFATVGVQPTLGRGYTAAEDEEGHDGVIVVSHEFWRNRLGGAPNALGSTIEADGKPRTLIGVMPPGFTVLGQRAEFLIPYGWTLERLRSARGRGSSFGLARLREHVTLEQATIDMTGIAAQLASEFPQRNAGWSVTLVPVHEQMVDQLRPAMRVLAGAVALVLLIACVNVANLLLARSAVRQRELGVRAALGAHRTRLIRQMLTESLLLSSLGGGVGLALAFLFHRGLVTLVASRIPIPRLDQVALDGTVLAVTGAIVLASGVLFGLAPSVVASEIANDALRDGGRHGSSRGLRRTLGVLVVAEVALSLVLLTGAGLLIRSFERLQGVDPGFQATGLFTARVQLSPSHYGDAARSAAFFTNALERISALPGVTGAAAISFLPLSGPGIATSFYPADQPPPAAGEAPVTEVRPITPGFFRTMGIPHREGRDIAVSDQADSPAVAVVSEGLARRYLADRNPIGRRLHVSIGPAGGRSYEVVGVVGDVKFGSLDTDARAIVYLPHTQLAIGMMTFVVRTEGDPLSLANGVSAAVRGLDSSLPLADVATMEGVVDATLARPRVMAVLLTVFSLVALALAGIGVYGLMAYTVAQQTRDIGVRMAMGATPAAVFRGVFAHGLRLIVIGLSAGLVAAAALTQVLKALLYQTESLDPLTYGAAVLVLLLVAAVAIYVPARRSTRIAPVWALRTE